MTIGPEPMTRIRLRSVRFGINCYREIGKSGESGNRWKFGIGEIGESGNLACVAYRPRVKSMRGSACEARLPDYPIPRLPDSPISRFPDFQIHPILFSISSTNCLNR